MFAKLQPFYDTVYLRQIWSGSKTFRRVMIAVLIFAALRLLVQVAVNVDPGYFPEDLRVYLQAARDLRYNHDLYPTLPLKSMEFYQYSPAYALVFMPLLWLPDVAVILLFTALHVVCYVLLYARWDRLFHKLGMDRARAMMVWTLPLWLVFAAFWNDMAYLNVYLIMALLGTFLIEAMIFENLFGGVLWLSIILQMKPHWAFAAALPLLLGRYRFFFKLILWAALVYGVVTGITLLAIGPDYGWAQYKDYARLLTRIDADHPWRGPNDPYLGYNHSITQTLVYLFGNHSSTMRFSLVLRVLLLTPLGLFGLRSLRHPALRPGHEVPALSLELVLALYTGVYIWLPVVWELSLGIAIFVYLLATMENKKVRIGLWLLFGLYALVDVVQIVSYLAFGDAVTDENPGPYIRTDISIYIPLIMIVTVVFYALLVWRCWRHAENASQPARASLISVPQ